MCTMEFQNADSKCFYRFKVDLFVGKTENYTSSRADASD